MGDAFGIPVIVLLLWGCAGLVFAGGLVGFIKARSTASLVAGLFTAGLLAFGASWAMTSPRNGYLLTFVVSLLLEVRFLSAYLKTRKPMPALPIMGIASLASLLSLVGLLCGR